MDSTIFNEVKIGKQVWMAENLNVATFRNGDPIPKAITADEWKKAGKNKQPAWCYYDNDPKNGENYGKLYNWYAVNDPRGLAPKGWHLPTYDEWTVLNDFLGGEEKAGTKMKSKTNWYKEGNGTNESGFNALPGGIRPNDGTFIYIGIGGTWWSSTQCTKSTAWEHGLNSIDGQVKRDLTYKDYGLSFRCLRD